MANTGILAMMTVLTLKKDFNFSVIIFENMKGLVKEQKHILTIKTINEGTFTIVKRLSKYKEGHRNADSDSDDEDVKLDALIEQKRTDAKAGESRKGKGKAVTIKEGEDDAGDDDTKNDTVKDENESDQDDEDDDGLNLKKKGRKAAGAKTIKRVSSDQLSVDVPVAVQPTKTPTAAQYAFTESKISEMLQTGSPQPPPVVQGSTVPIKPVQGKQTPSTSVPSVTEVDQGSSQQPRRKRGA
ncbi:hypothetical protein Hanom_Chr14g01246991 [Helianthus anomalus]